MVTSRAAVRIGRPELGSITVGAPADLTLFEVVSGKKQLIDSEGQERVATEFINVQGVVAGGTYHAC